MAKASVNITWALSSGDGTPIYICGNIAQLGAWNPDLGTTLTDQGVRNGERRWLLTLRVSPNQTVKFKFVRKVGDGTIQWEEGPDRTLNITNRDAYIECGHFGDTSGLSERAGMDRFLVLYTRKVLSAVTTLVVLGAICAAAQTLARATHFEPATLALVTALAVVYILIWQVPKVYVAARLRGDHVPFDRRLEIEDKARVNLAQIVGGSAFLISAYFTWRTLVSAEEKAINDRENAAIQRLATPGESASYLRLQALSELDTIAQARDTEHVRIMKLLAAFVRGQSGRSAGSQAEVQMAITVISRRNLYRMYSEAEEGRLDLSNANLRNVILPQEADLNNVILENADLRGATLNGVQFKHADLRSACLEGSHLKDADFKDADVTDATYNDLNPSDVEAINGAKLTPAQKDSLGRVSRGVRCGQ